MTFEEWYASSPHFSVHSNIEDMLKDYCRQAWEAAGRDEAVQPTTGTELAMQYTSPPRIVVMLEKLKADAVMSKFATARECQAYRAAVQDMLEMIYYETSSPAPLEPTRSIDTVQRSTDTQER